MCDRLTPRRDTLPTLAADPDTIRDGIKAVGDDAQGTGAREAREKQP
jgi:hypothetical protein